MYEDIEALGIRQIQNSFDKCNVLFVDVTEAAYFGFIQVFNFDKHQLLSILKQRRYAALVEVFCTDVAAYVVEFAFDRDQVYSN